MDFTILKLAGMVLFLSLGSLIACPFTFINDGPTDVFISNYDKKAGTLIKAGTTKNLEGAVAARLEVYIEKSKDSGEFDLRYLIIEEECAAKDAALPVLQFSKFSDMMNFKLKSGGLTVASPEPSFENSELE